jgi:type II secretory pathway predicted ATPase ExeA
MVMDEDEDIVARSARPGSAATTSHRMVLYESQKRALAELMAGMDEDARWILLIGPEGIGKSTVLESLLAQLELTDADVVICEGSEGMGTNDVLAALRRQLQLPTPRRNVLGRGHPGADIFASRETAKNPLAVLVDDAHHLSLETLRLLAEMAAPPSAENGGVWVVLVGPPALEEPALRACGKAKGMRCRLGPLTSAELTQYIGRRLGEGAERPPSISDEAVGQIARYTKGIPGVINTLCDVISRRPSVRLTNHVSAETVEEAAAQLGLDSSAQRKTSLPPDSVFSDAGPQDGEADERQARQARRRRAIALLTALVAFVAGLVIYIGPALPPITRTTLERLTVGGPPGPEAARSPSASEGGGRSLPSRRETASPGRPASRVTTDVTSRRQQVERRAPTPERIDKPSRLERAQPPAPTPEQIAALITGARDGRTADLAQALTSGVSPNIRDAYGVTPLMQAVQHGHLPAVSVLLDRGAQVNATDRGGITPAMLAVINERTETLELLLARGADVNARTGAGWTALTFAAWKGDPDLVRVLLRHGATPNVVDKQGWSPLDYATAQLRSPSSDGEGPPFDADFPVMSRGTRHAEVIPLLQGGAGR